MWLQIRNGFFPCLDLLQCLNFKSFCNSIYLFILYICLCLWRERCTRHGVWMLSFYHVDLRLWTQAIGLTASTFTGWAISLALNFWKLKKTCSSMYKINIYGSPIQMKYRMNESAERDNFFPCRRILNNLYSSLGVRKPRVSENACQGPDKYSREGR